MVLLKSMAMRHLSTGLENDEMIGRVPDMVLMGLELGMVKLNRIKDTGVMSTRSRWQVSHE